MDLKATDELMKSIADVVAQHIEKQIAPLKAQIAELEARTNFQYRGVWDEKTEYCAGNFVSDAGSVFYCNQRTKARPTLEPNGDWQLAVKRGRDGKDLLSGKGRT